MDCIALLHEARKAGLTVSTDGDKLHIRGPKAAQPLVQQLIARKPEVLALLASGVASHTYCPGCQSACLTHTPARTICTSCAAYWLPSIDLACDAPTATIRRQHPDGHEILIGVYRCPQCGEARWGPRLDTPSVWCCLTCAGLRQKESCNA